jgi:acyl-CoA thioesterase-2
VNSISSVLELERIEQDIFRGKSVDLNTGQVYGGQVLGQAIVAAQQTIEDRELHSVHAYFLRRGDVEAPIVYKVDRSRDGRSFGSRRVVAIQHGRPIFTLSASFQTHEAGLEYETRLDLPAIPDARESNLRSSGGAMRPSQSIEIRAVPSSELTDPNGIQWWIRAQLPEASSDDTHRAVFAYMSDLGLLATTLIPHGYPIVTDRERRHREIVMASIDHAIWYHRSFRADEWLLYDCSPLSTSGGRGLARGSVYSRSGELVATTIQEGLIRQKVL